MSLSANTQAILLLTTHFSKLNKGDSTPLTNKEWGVFARWLKEHDLTPENLLIADPIKTLSSWSDRKITPERISSLLNRGTSLALATERWLRAGLWIMTRSDFDYPKILKSRLKDESPPILFGCGNRFLLNKGGIAVVGSRNAGEFDKKFSYTLGIKVAKAGYSIISGGARGIDESAMLGALEADGTVIGVLADNLLRSTSSSKYRKFLTSNNLTLITPFSPEAAFNVGSAMQRNRYIYCLADTAVAVHSGKSGGTWNGALENLQKAWVPMWVKQTADLEAGNNALIIKGAKQLSSDIDSLNINTLSKLEDSINNIDNKTSAIIQNVKNISIPKLNNFSENLAYSSLNDLSFYQFFLHKIEQLCTKTPKTINELEKDLNLKKSQLDIWLKQAIQDSKIIKQRNPTCYLWKRMML